MDRDNLGLGLSYILSEKCRIGLNGSYVKTDYDYEHNVDYDGSSVSFSFSRIMDSETDTLFLQPYYSENSSSFSSVESMGMYTGWARDFSETFSITLYIGARRSKTKYYFLKERNRGWLADVSIDKRGETWKAGIGLNRDLSFSSLGDPIETDKFYLNFGKNLTEKFRHTFSVEVNKTESVGSFSSKDTMYYNFNNSLSYLIGRKLYISLSYRYSINHDSLRTIEKSVDRNMFTIGLRYSFEERL